ncbi:MAG: hypothetical protein CMG00_04160 [Candidatus Marinimicrobia bacterium]|nr:hypothetical protein [Candidatus Neomarinimicrobiota bacterium]|tara:strand:- start:4001 stop:4993 length:993 start_codon:yes stop_codon:yes gene_type:complete
MTVNRKDQDFKGSLSKSKDFEDIISDINKYLYDSYQKRIKKSNLIDFPVIHIIGAPRSGTTLLHQFLTSSFDIGYINNLIAAFWKVPVYGIELSKKLLNQPGYSSSYKSKFGRTENINEPHEFGYFWSYWLNYKDFIQKNKDHEKTIDWHNLSQTINNMSNSFNKPIAFKSFLMGFHSKKMYNVMPNSIFIFIKRDLISNVNSVLDFRQKALGSEERWGSIKPKEYKQFDLFNKYEQVVSQIELLNFAYEKQLDGIPDSNKFFIDYKDLCLKPNSFIDDLNILFSNYDTLNVKSSLPEGLNFNYRYDDSNEIEILNAKKNVYKKFNINNS